MITKNVKSPKTNRELDLTLNFGTDLDDAISKFGKEVIFSNFQRMCATDASNKARALLNDAANPADQVKAKVESWIPGVVSSGGITKDPVAVLESKIAAGEMSDEDIKALAARLQAAIKGKK